MRQSTRALAVLVSVLATGPLFAGSVTLVPIQDNTLYEIPSDDVGGGGNWTSNGAGEYFFAGRTLIFETRRALLAFDVAGSVPSGAVITDVVLTLQMSRTISGQSTVSLHPVLADWGEGASDAPGEEGGGAPAEPGDATWIHTFFDTGFWATPGGDFLASPSAAITVDAPGSYSWGSTAGMVADVQSWLDDPTTNFGWLVRGDEVNPASAKRFNTRENGNAATVPQLVIDFQAPVPTAPVWTLIFLMACLLAAGMWALGRALPSQDGR